MITNTVSKVTYTGDGTTKQFQVIFPFIATTDLQLFLRTIATGEYEEIDSNWSYDEGYVTYPVTGSAIDDTKQIIIQRSTPLTQEKDNDVRLFTSEDIEGMADKLTQITQELKRDIEEVSSTESIDIDIASAIGRHNVHPQAHYDLFANKVAKTGSTMTGNLTLSNGSQISVTNENNDGYHIYCGTYQDNPQLRLYRNSSGAGVYLNSADGEKPYYYDGNGNAARLLNNNDKITLETSIAGKANTDLSNVTKPYVTETYVNGTSWYRVWSDGWCEQGGRTTNYSGAGFQTITLLKPMLDTNYTLLNCNNSDASRGDQRDAYIISNTQIGVGYDNSQDGGAIWKVEGYIATGD